MAHKASGVPEEIQAPPSTVINFLLPFSFQLACPNVAELYQCEYWSAPSRWRKTWPSSSTSLTSLATPPPWWPLCSATTSTSALGLVVDREGWVLARCHLGVTKRRDRPEGAPSAGETIRHNGMQGGQMPVWRGSVNGRSCAD